MASRYQSGKTRAEVKEKYNSYAPEQGPFESDAEYLKRLGKQADQRMRRLEKLALQPGYENVLKWSYAQAKADLKRMGSNRFETVAKRTKEGEYNKRDLQKRINAVKRFLESPTSTKSMIDKQYGGAAAKLNSEYGTDFTWSEVGKFFDSSAWKNLEEKYKSSKTLLRAVGMIRKLELASVDDVNKAIKAEDTRTEYIDDSEVTDVVKKLLRKNGVNRKDIARLKGI